MAEQKRLIGNNYDRAVFEDAFRRSARAMAEESYASPDSPTGMTLQEMLIKRMRKVVEETPIEYYQLLEAFAGDGKVESLAGGAFVEGCKDTGDSRLVKLLMEMTEEYDESKIKLTDPQAAEKYFDEKFAASQKGKRGKVRLSLGEQLKGAPKSKAKATASPAPNKEKTAPERSER